MGYHKARQLAEFYAATDALIKVSPEADILESVDLEYTRTFGSNATEASVAQTIEIVKVGAYMGSVLGL